MFRFLFPVLILFAQAVQAEITIIDVRKNIPLSDEDPSYTDFYLGAGENESLKKNMVVTVFRTINVRDSSGAQSFGEISIPVGQVKIVAVFAKVAVAREYKLLPRDVNPMLEQIGLMSGDRIETKDSFVDNSVPKRKPQAIAVTPKVEASTITTVTATSVSVVPAPQVVSVPTPVSPAKIAAAAAKAPEAETAKEEPELVNLNPLNLPNELTKTAQDGTVPNALFDEVPVNNTANEGSKSKSPLPAQ